MGVNRNVSIRTFRGGNRRRRCIVLTNILVRRDRDLLTRSSNSMMLRTLTSTLLNTLTLNSVNRRFPSASTTRTNLSSQMLLHCICDGMRTTKCVLNGTSVAIVYRHPGLTPRGRTVHRGVTDSLRASVKRIDIGTAAARGLNFANQRRNVVTGTIMLLIPGIIRTGWQLTKPMCEFYLWCHIGHPVCRPCLRDAVLSCGWPFR